MSWQRAAVACAAVVAAAACGAAGRTGGEPPSVQVAGVVETRPVAEPSPLVAAGFDQPPTSVVDATVAPAVSTSQPAVATSTVAPPTSAAAPTSAAPPTSAAAPTSAAPVTLPEASLRDRTLALVDYPWETRLPAWRIEFTGARSGVRGLTFPDTKLIEIYVRPTDSPATLARVLAHELGHAVDLELNSAADRQRWRDVRGIGNGARWWPDASSSDFETGAGDFAEAFAVWLTGVTSLSRIGAPLSADHLSLVAQLAVA